MDKESEVIGLRITKLCEKLLKREFKERMELNTFIVIELITTSEYLYLHTRICRELLSIDRERARRRKIEELTIKEKTVELKRYEQTSKEEQEKDIKDWRGKSYEELCNSLKDREIRGGSLLAC
jgi:hypothetical protein